MKEEPTEYHVYVHRDPKTRIPFYVGRGKGKRAISKDRGFACQEMVNKLDGEYDIEYLKEDITKDESLYWEGYYIQKFGKILEGTGTLVNRTDGGVNEGMAISFGGGPPEPYKQEDVTEYEMKDLSVEEAEELLKELCDNNLKYADKYWAIKEKYGDRDGMDETDLEYLLDGIIGQIPNERQYFSDGGYPLEQVVEDLEMHCEEIDDELENREDDNEEIIKLAKKLQGFLKDSLKKFLKD